MLGPCMNAPLHCRGGGMLSISSFHIFVQRSVENIFCIWPRSVFKVWQLHHVLGLPAPGWETLGASGGRA